MDKCYLPLKLCLMLNYYQDLTNLDCMTNIASSVPRNEENSLETVAPKIYKDWLNNPYFDRENKFYLQLCTQ